MLLVMNPYLECFHQMSSFFNDFIFNTFLSITQTSQCNHGDISLQLKLFVIIAENDACWKKIHCKYYKSVTHSIIFCEIKNKTFNFSYLQLDSKG